MWTVKGGINLLTITLLIVINTPVPSKADLRLESNGYEGLVVAISNSVPEEHCNQLIHGLKDTLREFSKVLWSVTRGQAALRDVTVVVPNAWKNDGFSCSSLSSLTTSAAAVIPEVHIRIKGSHPVFGARPWVHQTQGCGKAADYIQMGSSILLSSSTVTTSHTADLLMAEWVKFRWGIFEENGFPNDPLYPDVYQDPITKDIVPNSCTSRHTMPPPICPAVSHRPEAPTKHNAQCRGQPAWSIVMQSQDFIDGRNRPSNITPLPPGIRFITEILPQLVLLVEDTAAMNIQKRWEFVRKAVRHVMVYDVLDDVYVSIVIFNSEAKTTAQLVRVESLSDVRQRIGSSLPRNPSTVPESQKCILCGIQEAVRALGRSPTGSKAGKVILMTTGNRRTPSTEVEKIRQLMHSHKIKMDVIFYPLTERRTFSTSVDSLKALVSEEKGATFSVMDEGVGKDSKLGMMVALMNALYSTMHYSSVSSSPVESVRIHSVSYRGGITSLSEGSFILDDSYGPSVRFSIYYNDLNHVGNTMKLTSPTGKTIDAINTQEDGDANVISLNIPQAERGHWYYQVENRADSHQALHVQVTSSESVVRRITLKFWMNIHTNIINITDLLTPIIVYAEVRDDDGPVLNAKVIAKLQRLGTNTSGSSYDSLPFELLDNGNGDPDITGDDGVYSRYMPTVYGGTGQYRLSVVANHNDGFARSPAREAFTRHGHINPNKRELRCCGSYMKYKHLKPIAAFRRYHVYGVLDILALSSGKDIVPPNRILDLRTDINRTTHEISLVWTAPGDDYDHNRAHHYEAVVADSWANANTFNGERLGDLPYPRHNGKEQEASVKIIRYEQIVYIAIRAVDEAGNRGAVSNIALQWVPLAPTTAPIITSPNTLQPSDNIAQPLEREVTEQQVDGSFSLEYFAIIGGSSGGFLLVILAIVIFCYIHVTRLRCQRERDANEKVESCQNIMIKTDSTPSLAQNDSPTSAKPISKTEEIELRTDHSPSPTISWRTSNLQLEHGCQATTGELPVEVVESQPYIQGIPDPILEPFPDHFPDITHISGHAYLFPQVPTSLTSDLTSYQYQSEMPSTYTHTFPCEHPNTSLPPYTPYVMSTYPAEVPVSCDSQVPSQLGEVTYEIQPVTCPAQIACTIGDTFCSPPLPIQYTQCPNNPSDVRRTSGYAVVSPPAAFQPALETRVTTVASTTLYSDPQCSSITHL